MAARRAFSSLRDVRPLPPGFADPSYAGRGERTVDVMRPGGFDQREAPGFQGCRPPYLPLGSRPDVLVFQTEPLREPTEVTGPIEVHLWVATSAVDTDFTAKLIDVYPPSAWCPQGYALNLTDSIAWLRYRNGRERGEPATPGEPVQVTLTLYPTSNLFMPGHRIRLDVSSSNFPRFDVNPNTGEAIGRERRRVVADNTVFHERGRESRVVLPAIPTEITPPCRGILGNSLWHNGSGRLKRPQPERSLGIALTLNHRRGGATRRLIVRLGWSMEIG